MFKNKTTDFLLSLLGIIFISTYSFAQQLKISDKPEQFIPDIQALMAVENNTAAIAMAKKFEINFNNLNSEQKPRVIVLCRKMLSKGYKMPHYYLYFEVLSLALEKEKFNSAAIDNFMSISQKVVENYDIKAATKTFESVRDFMEKRLLYNANYNRLYAIGGSYSLEFYEKKVENATKVDEKSVFDTWDNSASNELEDATLQANKVITKKIMPTLAGIGVALKGVDLVFATATDSVFIKQSNGTVSWKEGIFVGKGGKFTWENAGLPQVFANLNDYYFEIRNPRFTAENVSLNYPAKLNTPIQGVFEYKSEKRNKNASPSFPRFMSYQGDAIIKHIDQNIEYKGGFSLSGSRIYSSSLNNKFSTIIVKKQNVPIFKTTSTRFEISDTLITARLASFVTYLEKDSIYHPAIKLSYNQKNNFLKLNKIEESGFRDTPYADSYHQLEIKADAMRWDLNSGKMDFYITAGKNIIPAVFESFDYFDPQRVRDLSANSSFNPLIAVGNYTRTKNKATFYVEEIAQSFHIDPKTMFGSLMTTVQQGFVSFDPNSNLFKIMPKGLNYLQALNGKRDFDDISIKSLYTSRDSTANASINMVDKSLIIRGTRGFSISDSLRVLIIPYDQSIRVAKNRAFMINGQIKTGNFRFAGKELLMDYSNFTVDLNKIDSIKFIPQAIYSKGGKKEIGEFVKYLKPGKLFINKPDNKSGKTYLPEYPKLLIDGGVNVFFDQRERGAKTYDRSVHFDIPKIDYDSLNIRDIAFVGTFYSGGIFAPFQEKLLAMPDTTIGFSHEVPKGIYNVYGANSSVKFAANLLMDAKGLHSFGSIQHLAAMLEAKDINFMVDSLTAKGDIGEIKEQNANNIYFPQVAIQEYNLVWKPKSDSMLIGSKIGFSFYAKTSAFNGKLIVRSTGLHGSGQLKRTDSETASEQFKFNKEGFLADLAQLKVNATTANKPVFLGKNVNIWFNVLNENAAIQTANIKLETPSAMEFPYAAYKTNIGRADWNIKEQQISMRGDVNNAIFSSMNPQQEGLAFHGSSAIYDIQHQTLNIKGVPFIKTADASVSPHEGSVSIRANAEMLPFKNARLTVDTLNAYHNLIQGNIKIVSANRFMGDATYQFVNVRKDTFNIKMGNFELKAFDDGENTRKKEKKYATTARANVSVRDSLFLSPKILYKGEITMLAPLKSLNLDGFVVPELKKHPQLGGHWIAYKGNKSEEVTINVDKNLNSSGNPIYAGLFEKSSGAGIYPTFLSPKTDPTDHAIFIANGLFKRDETNKLYSIKPEGGSIVGNKYELLDEAEIIKLEGSFELLSNKNSQYLQTSGFAKIRLDTPKHAFNTMMVLSFPIPVPVLLSMATKIVKTNLDEGNNEGANAKNNFDFQMKLAQFVGEKGLDDFKTKSITEYVPLYKTSVKFNAPLVFSDLNLQWNAKLNSFFSIGKLGVSNIGETDINTKIDGYVEIRKNTSTGDEVYVFLVPSPNVWYYFGYRNGQMGLASSEQSFNDIMAAKIDKTAKNKDYSLIGVDAAEAIGFRNDFLKLYGGIKPEQVKVNNTKVLNKGADTIKKETKKIETKDGF